MKTLLATTLVTLGIAAGAFYFGGAAIETAENEMNSSITVKMDGNQQDMAYAFAMMNINTDKK